LTIFILDEWNECLYLGYGTSEEDLNVLLQPEAIIAAIAKLEALDILGLLLYFVIREQQVNHLL
jgi:hypothetical protein